MTLENEIILITGGLGQIGIALIQKLQSKRLTAKNLTAHIHVLDLKIPESGDSNNIAGIIYHAGDITDEQTVSKVFESIRPEVVFHTAGLIPQIAQRLGMDNEKSYMKVNYEGTKIVLEESKKVAVKAFVYTSSADVVKGNSWLDLKGVNEDLPIPEVFDGFYAKSKARAEAYVLASSTTSFPTTAIRTHAAFGVHDNNLIPLLLAAPRNISLGPGTNLYDFTYTPNIALAHELAAISLLSNEHAAGKAFFITNSEPVAFRTFVRWVYDASDGIDAKDREGRKTWVIPLSVAKGAIWIGEKIAKITGKRPFLTMKDLGDSVAERWFDNSKAKEGLGYAPEVGLQEGVRRAVEGYQDLKASK